MTNNIKPNDGGTASPMWEVTEFGMTLRDYARANIAHNTAALQAEIEALRAEVERLENCVLQIERYVLRNAPPEIGFLNDDARRAGEGEQQ